VTTIGIHTNVPEDGSIDSVQKQWTDVKFNYGHEVYGFSTLAISKETITFQAKEVDKGNKCPLALPLLAPGPFW
jgi:hypothetical protein